MRVGEIIVICALVYLALCLVTCLFILIAGFINRNRKVVVTDKEYEEFLVFMEKYKKDKNKKKNKKGEA